MEIVIEQNITLFWQQSSRQNEQRQRRRQTHATQVAMNHALAMQILNALSHLQDLQGKLNIYSDKRHSDLREFRFLAHQGSCCVSNHSECHFPRMEIQGILHQILLDPDRSPKRVIHNHGKAFSTSMLHGQKPFR